MTSNQPVTKLPRSERQVPSTAFHVLARLINTEDSLEKIGRELGVSGVRVGQIQKLALCAGIEFKARHRAND